MAYLEAFNSLTIYTRKLSELGEPKARKLSELGEPNATKLSELEATLITSLGEPIPSRSRQDKESWQEAYQDYAKDLIEFAHSTVKGLQNRSLREYMDIQSQSQSIANAINLSNSIKTALYLQ